MQALHVQPPSQAQSHDELNTAPPDQLGRCSVRLVRVRIARAMNSVHELLTWPQAGVAPLFTPPFDDGPTNPGYIKGYPPGIRENGGQYPRLLLVGVRLRDAQQGARAMELFDILDPIRHADSAQGAARYVVEPYVALDDVYSVAPYVGRGYDLVHRLLRVGVARRHRGNPGFRPQARPPTWWLDPCVPRRLAGLHANLPAPRRRRANDDACGSLIRTRRGRAWRRACLRSWWIAWRSRLIAMARPARCHRRWRPA